MMTSMLVCSGFASVQWQGFTS